MKAIWASGYGNHEVLKVKNVPIPSILEHEVLVEVRASVATTADTMMLQGKPRYGRIFTGLLKPKHQITGTAFSGVISKVGAEVKSFKTGDQVFGETTLGFGTHAEFVAVPEKGVLLKKPETMSHIDGATFCDGPLTAWNFLKELGHLKPGQNVLINGASGSIGTATVQLAKYLGAEVTGVCSEANMGLVKSLGANNVINYQKEDFTKSSKQFDIIFDTVGKTSFRQVKPILKEKGLYLSPVLTPSLLLQSMLPSFSNGKKAKFSATGLISPPKLRNMLLELVEIFNSGKLKIVLDRQYPLEKVSKAFDYVSKGHKKGNVVIFVVTGKENNDETSMIE